MNFYKGKEAVIGDEIRVQRGPHAAKAGDCAARDGTKLLVKPWPGASWEAFWIEEDDVAVYR